MILKKNAAVLSFFSSLYIILALNLNLSVVSSQQMAQTSQSGLLAFLSSFKTHNLEQVLIFIFSYTIVKKCIFLVSQKRFIGLKNWLLYIVPSALFSLFMVVGFSFKTAGDASCIICSKYQFFKAFFVGGGYFILFLCLIILLFEEADKLSLFSAEPVSPDSCLFFFYRHPFILSYLIMLICYVPYIVLSYPAIFAGDTIDQIWQGYNLQSFHKNLQIPLISESVKMTNHHPIVHTLVLHYFIALGKYIHSYNFGLFLFAFFQLNLVISVISFVISVLIKRFHIKLKYAAGILAYFLIHPLVQNYMMLITKDVIFTILFLLFLLFSFLLLKQGDLSLNQYLIWILTMLGVILTRNDGIYLIVPTLFCFLLLNEPKKMIGSALVIMVGFFLIWHHVVLPFFKITPGSIREMLNIPLQQTARYVKYQSQKVTRREKKAISAVLDYRKIERVYTPEKSDSIKKIFKESSTNEQRVQYLKIWASMFRKAPTLYIEAIVANKYEFLYPAANLGHYYGYETSERRMEFTNSALVKEEPFDFQHPEKLRAYRNQYEQSRNKIFELPVLCIVQSASTYTWFLILLICYALKQKNRKILALFVPFIMQFLVLMAGPCNGSYFRYMYFYIVTVPFLFIFYMNLKSDSISNQLAK